MNLPVPVAVGIWVLVGVLLLVLVLTGRRRLAARTVGVVPVPPGPPTERGPVSAGPLDALYVSSTLAGDWLARVGAHGLGDRARGVVTVHADGVHVARQGTTDVWIPADAVDGVALSPGMAGKFVGKEAIVVVTWTVPAAPVPDAHRSTDGTVPAAVRLDTGLLPRRDADVPVLLAAVRTLADATRRRSSVPDDPDPEPSPAADEPNDKEHP